MKQHLSSEQITRLLMDEESQAEQRHLSECEVCRTEFDHLRNALSLYRDAGRNWSGHWMHTPATPRPDRSHKFGWWAAGSGMAVAALAAVLLVWPSASPQRMEEPFVSIPYVVPAAPYERTQVTRMNVPVAALRSAGIAVQLWDAGASVRADVLVGQDGRALAVRLIDRRFH